MTYRINFHPLAVEDLKPLPRDEQERILAAIQSRLGAAADKLGKPLTSGWRGHRRLRMGDYRVIYRISGTDVHVIKIGHRKNIYDEIRRLYGLDIPPE